jgi:hypothetical protein
MPHRTWSAAACRRLGPGACSAQNSSCRRSLRRMMAVASHKAGTLETGGNFVPALGLDTAIPECYSITISQGFNSALEIERLPGGEMPVGQWLGSARGHRALLDFAGWHPLPARRTPSDGLQPENRRPKAVNFQTLGFLLLIPGCESRLPARLRAKLPTAARSPAPARPASFHEKPWIPACAGMTASVAGAICGRHPREGGGPSRAETLRALCVKALSARRTRRIVAGSRPRRARLLSPAVQESFNEGAAIRTLPAGSSPINASEEA